MNKKATYELKNIIKALSIMEVLNTPEENQRLREAKEELNKMLLDTANDRVIQAKEDREQATIN